MDAGWRDVHGMPLTLRRTALRAAPDGANVAIAAKTESPHPTLEGTIYTAPRRNHFSSPSSVLARSTSGVSKP